MYPQQTPPPSYAPAAAAGPHARLDPLGIAYMVLGGVDLAWALFMLAVSLAQVAGVFPHDAGDGSQAYTNGYYFGEGLSVFLSSLGLPVGAATLFAGMKMRRGELYALALVMTFANMVPCYQTACCALFGVPLGIWSLITLFDSEVKATFR